MLKGWKTYLGAAITAMSAVVPFFPAMQSWFPQVFAFGTALGLVGIRAKQERSNPGA